MKDNGWMFWLPNEYQIVENRKDYDGYEFMKFLHMLILFAAIGLTYAIMFG